MIAPPIRPLVLALLMCTGWSVGAAESSEPSYTDQCVSVRARAEGSGLIPLTACDLDDAAATFSVPRLALLAIYMVEGGRVGACSAANDNGSVDCCPMQINTIHGKRYGAILGVSPKQALAMIRDNGRLCIFVAAHHLRDKIQAAGGNVFEGIGRYHSETPVFKERYQAKIRKALQRLQAQSKARSPE